MINVFLYSGLVSAVMTINKVFLAKTWLRILAINSLALIEWSSPFKTTIFGILSLQPHINFIVISPANFEEYLDETFTTIKMSCLLKIPFVVVFIEVNM